MSLLDDTLAPDWRKLHVHYAAWRGQARAYFQRLNPRERRLVLCLMAVALAALVWLILIAPAWDDIANSRAPLPGLRTQAATVASLTSQARGLGRQAAARAPEALPGQNELQASLRQAGLQDAQWSLPSPGGGDGKSIVLKFSQAPADALLRWLDTTPRDWRLSVSQAELLRSRDTDHRRLPGRVDGTVTLAPRAAEGSK